MHQVKLYIASSPDFLPVFIGIRIRYILSFFYNRNISRNKRIAAGFAKGQPEMHFLVVIGPLIIVENTTDSTPLIVAMEVDKIVVADFFEFRVK